MENKILKNYEVPCFKVILQTEADIVTESQSSVYVDQGDFFD